MYAPYGRANGPDRVIIDTSRHGWLPQVAITHYRCNALDFCSLLIVRSLASPPAALLSHTTHTAHTTRHTTGSRTKDYPLRASAEGVHTTPSLLSLSRDHQRSHSTYHSPLLRSCRNTRGSSTPTTTRSSWPWPTSHILPKRVRANNNNPKK